MGIGCLLALLLLGCAGDPPAEAGSVPFAVERIDPYSANCVIALGRVPGGDLVACARLYHPLEVYWGSGRQRRYEATYQPVVPWEVEGQAQRVLARTLKISISDVGFRWVESGWGIAEREALRLPFAERLDPREFDPFPLQAPSLRIAARQWFDEEWLPLTVYTLGTFNFIPAPADTIELELTFEGTELTYFRDHVEVALSPEKVEQVAFNQSRTGPWSPSVEPVLFGEWELEDERLEVFFREQGIWPQTIGVRWIRPCEPWQQSSNAYFSLTAPCPVPAIHWLDAVSDWGLRGPGTAEVDAALTFPGIGPLPEWAMERIRALGMADNNQFESVHAKVLEEYAKRKEGAR